MCKALLVRGLLCFVVVLVHGCSSDEAPVAPPPNERPTITFSFTKTAVGRNSDVILTVDVDDPDGDSVTVTWAVTAGSLDANAQGTPTMRWTTPLALGPQTVTMTAADGKGGTRTISEVMLVSQRRSADLGGDEQWTAANSPYIVAPGTGIFSIPSAWRLTIEAGVEVYVEPGVEIQVNGELVTVGTASQPVAIRGNVRAAAPGFWKGILGDPDGTPVPRLSIDHTSIAHAVNALRARGTTEVEVTNSEITVCSGAGILHNATGRLVVESSEVTNNERGGIRVEQAALGPPDFVTIRGDSIAVNGLFDGTPYTQGEAGISIDLIDPMGMVPIEISGNEISRNDFPGIRLINAVFPRITGNGIFGNELLLTNKINIRLEPPFGDAGGSTEIVAIHNWWGLPFLQDVDSLVIKQGIFDADHPGYPDPSFVRVSVGPWLHENP